MKASARQSVHAKVCRILLSFKKSLRIADGVVKMLRRVNVTRPLTERQSGIPKLHRPAGAFSAGLSTQLDEFG
jgi:hypothetical protein